ncbi:MAG: ATP-binding protein [Chitinispirillales bacterium]|nr:ATP-binding protein [Chitinispirillales bacterium]
MFENSQNLLNQIKLGEDATLEFKCLEFSGASVCAPHRNSMSDELAAMANTKGGVFIILIDDKTRRIIGIPTEKLDIAEEWLRNIANDLINPPLARLPVNVELVDGKRGFIMDKRGDGVPIIYSESVRVSGRKPIYELIDDTELKLTVFAGKPNV